MAAWRRQQSATLQRLNLLRVVVANSGVGLAAHLLLQWEGFVGNERLTMSNAGLLCEYMSSGFCSKLVKDTSAFGDSYEILCY